MIRITIDINAIKEAKLAFSVSDNLTYIKAYKAVQEALLVNKDLEVIIRVRIYKVWFERMSERHPGKFTFSEVSLRSLLEEKWKIPIHSTISDDDITELKLFNIYEKPAIDTQINDFLLEYFYSPVLGLNKLEIEDIPTLLNDYDPIVWGNNSKHSLLKNTYEGRLNLWHEKANKDLRSILNKITNDIQAFRLELIQYHILKNYKKLLKNVIPDYYLYDAMKLNTYKLKYDENELSSLLNQIQYEINTWKTPSDETEVIAFINSMSGFLMFEFNHIMNILNLNPGLISIEGIKSIEIRFQRLTKEIKEDVELLRTKIPPEFPEEPNMAWSVEQMLAWCTKEYFPYFYWAIINSNDSAQLTELGDIFSEWYYKEYENIIANDEHILFKFLPNNFKSFDSKNKINIVLIIDNLPWFVAKELKDIFEKSKFNLSEIQPYLSMLPSITEVSKKCLLTGQDRYNKIEEKSYKNILESKGWLPYFEEKKFKYYPNLGAFKNERNLAPGAYFINYLEIDELFHKSEEELGSLHIDYIKDYLKRIVKILIGTLRKNNVLNDSYIHIISDHGATKLSPSKESLIDDDYFKNNEAFDGSYRYLKLETKTLISIPSYIKDQCFLIDETRFGTPTNYIVPKTNKSFSKVNDNIWTHGGLLPEEVIIPHMLFKKVDFNIERPDIILTNNSFRYAVQNIDMEIGNPNEYLMEDIYISILNTNYDAEENTIKIPEIKAKSKILILFKGKFKQTRIKREREWLSVEIRCTVRSNDYKFETDCPIILKSMIETKGEDVFDKLDF